MKKLIALLNFSVLSISLSGCEVIGDIFKAGVWTGVIIIAVLIAVLFFIIRLFKK